MTRPTVSPRTSAMRTSLRIAALFAVAASLAACGGGGSAADPEPPSSGTPSPAPVPGPSPVAGGPDLQTSVPPATYAAGSLHKGAWDLLQSQRAACGFGLLLQDERLDAASQAHAYYLGQNTIENPDRFFIGHYEDPAWPYYTGVAPWDRAAAAGFPDSVSEILTNQGINYPVQFPSPFGTDEAQGAQGMRDLINTVYHLKGAMWAGRRGGIGAVSLIGPAGTGREQSQFRLVMQASDETDALKQRLGAGVVATYPCDGLAGVATTWYPVTESPRPFPDVGLEEAYGPPIYLKADAGSILQVGEARIARADGAATVAHRTLAQADDPAGLLESHELFVVPTAALAPSTAYTVTVSGLLNGQAFTTSFTFSTQ